MTQSQLEQELTRRLRTPAGLGKADLPNIWQTPPHLQIIDSHLRGIEDGFIRRLFVAAPPRHGKSQLISHYFPAWYLLVNPSHRVILTSYEADFAAQWGRKVRDTVTKWGPLFSGVRVRDDSKAADRWEIETFGGGMQTAGAGGAITGKGSNLFIIDDPTKNSEEALSPTHRQKLWDWYLSTAETRLEPGGAIVVTQQRWHTDDLGGRLTREQPALWRTLNFRAIAENDDILGRNPGGALWKERFDEEELNRRRQGSPQWFAAQYQQHPLDLEGGFFKGLEKIKVIQVRPTATQFTKRVRFWDLASTEAQAGADPDWTVGVELGRHLDKSFWILDLVRVRVGPKAVRQLIRQTAERDGKELPIRIEREGGASGKIVADLIVSEELAGWKARAVRPDGSKEERAEPWASQIEAGNVCMVKAEWNGALLAEHQAFPNGDHDDIVDGCSGAIADMTSRFDLDCW